MTNSMDPRGYDPESHDAREHENFLTAAFQSHVIWKDAGLTRSRIRIIHPTEVIFKPPGQPQLRPDVEVLGLHTSLFR